MTLLARISNWWNQTGAKVYNGIRNGVSTGYHAVKAVSHKIGDMASGIDNLLTQARSVPVVGQVAEALQNNSYYKDAQDLVKRGVNVVDQVGEVGNAIDSAVQKYMPAGSGGSG